jgi:hypothetical protein
MTMSSAISTGNGVPPAPVVAGGGVGPAITPPQVARAMGGAGTSDIARFLTAVVPWPANDGDGHINIHWTQGATPELRGPP